MNKFVGMGRLTKSPEIRQTQSNKSVCNFTIAINRRFQKDEADFINCVAWEKTSDFISKYFTKGDMIAVVGRIQTRSYDGNDGKKVYVTEVVVEEAYFTGSKNGQAKKTETSQQSETSEMLEGFAPLTDDDQLPF